MKWSEFKARGAVWETARAKPTLHRPERDSEVADDRPLATVIPLRRDKTGCA